ncbi:MAG: PEP-CTERM sorting domain-containing protein [Rhodocyclaceae bacterium]|nr:PEP-CTERM sorting domain-containing protein [Rhodocyclaceae bacterium]
MKMRQIALALAVSLASTASLADTLNFEAFPSANLGSPVLVMPNATVTGAAASLFNLSSIYLVGMGGAICSLTSSWNCEADLTIDFASAVSNLSFQTVGYDGGDSVTISAFAGATLLGSQTIVGDQTVDFTAYSGVTRLYFDDASTGAGYGYGAFNFNTAPVPEPETYAMMLAGLGLIGAAAKRRRKA